MPPKSKTPKELNADRKKIINKAVVIINKHGLKGMTMRKLATSLKMSATNLYNYFENKDEIYLHILVDSFELLHKKIENDLTDGLSPIEQLESYMRNFIQFGVQNESRYELMLGTREPKALAYTNTPSEPLAIYEKEVAMKPYHTLCRILTDLHFTSDESVVWLTAVRIISELHGAVDLYHSKIIFETANEPEKVFESIIDHILSQFK